MDLRKVNESNVEPAIKDEVKPIVEAICKYVDNIEEIGSEIYVGTSSTKDSYSDSSEYDDPVNATMGENFDLRAAAGLLPIMDGTESVTKQLIDGIEIYDELLDAQVSPVVSSINVEAKAIDSNETHTEATSVAVVLVTLKPDRCVMKSSGIISVSGISGSTISDGEANIILDGLKLCHTCLLMADFERLRTNKEAATIARTFVDNFGLRYGVPQIRAPNFSLEYSETYNLLNVKQLNSTAYHIKHWDP
nr:unnamed protein product [Callosobruchus chinensis]